jgi:hypothetical protein
MRSIIDRGWTAALFSETLGTFDYVDMSMSLHQLEEAEEVFYQGSNAIESAVKKGELTEDAAVNQLMQLRREPKTEAYLRVRVHEKAHYYQHISTSAGVARPFAAGEGANFLKQVLRELPKNIRIGLPLALWVVQSKIGADSDLAAMLRLFNMRLLADFALNGDLFAEHFIKPGEHILQSAHPELPAKFWETDDYKLGFRPIAEGGAKAAEWLYLVRNDPSAADRAMSDISGCPEEYHLAFDFLRKHLPGHHSVLAYLQTMSVVCDFALHPLLTRATWPLIWTPDSAHPVESIFPGMRFTALVRLLAQAGGEVDLEEKASVFKWLSLATQKMLGWASPEAATKSLLVFVEEALQVHSNDVAEWTSDWEKWAKETGDDVVHPMIRQKNALQARLEDEMAFIAPVNAEMLNSRHLVSTGFVGSARFPPSDWERNSQVSQWYLIAIATILALEQYPYCPLLFTPRMQREPYFRMSCAQLTSGKCSIAGAKKIGGWKHLLKCGNFREVADFFSEREGLSDCFTS